MICELLVFAFLFFSSCQRISILPLGDGGGSIIECPKSKDAILFNYRRLGHFGGEGYLDYLVSEVNPDAFQNLKFLIVSGLEFTDDALSVLKKIKEAKDNGEKIRLKEIIFQGSRAEYKSPTRSMHHEKREDLIDFINKEFPFIKYHFVDDDEYFKLRYFCEGDNEIEFLLMNSATLSTPTDKKTQSSHNVKHRGWSLKIKNYRSRLSMTFSQGVESFEELNLQKMIKKYYEKPKTHVLKLSHFKGTDEIENEVDKKGRKISVLKRYNPSLIFTGMGCPKKQNNWLMKCSVLEKTLELKRLRKVEDHSIICGDKDKRITIENFDLGVYSTTPSTERMDILQYDLENDLYSIIPVFFQDSAFRHPCVRSPHEKERIDYSLDNIEEFKKYMNDNSFLDIKVKEQEEKEKLRKEVEEQEFQNDHETESIDIGEDEEEIDLENTEL